MAVSSVAMFLGTASGPDGIGRIPTMAGATTSGVTMVGTSNFDGTLVGWKAGDKNFASPGNQWMSALSVNGNLNIDLGTAYTIYSYDAANTTYQGGLTTGWNLQGANISDYSDAVTIDTRSRYMDRERYGYPADIPGNDSGQLSLLPLRHDSPRFLLGLRGSSALFLIFFDADQALSKALVLAILVRVLSASYLLTR